MMSSLVYGIGGFTQAEWLTDDRGRFALGAQAGTFVGLEAGWALVTKGSRTARWSGPHLGLYASAGLLNLGLRLTLPVENGAGDPPDVDLSLVVSLKVPLTLPELEWPDIGHFH
jgi:hypothetical protein